MARFGYQIHRNLLKMPEIIQIREKLETIIKMETAYNYYENDKLNRVEHFMGLDAELDKIIWNACSPLLDQVWKGGWYLFKDKLNCKQPDGVVDLLHCDQQAGWDKYAQTFVSIAIFLSENTKENGAISFDKTGEVVEWQKWVPMSEDADVFEDHERFDLVTGLPGDAVIFDSFVPHGSPQNKTPTPRWNLYLTFNAKKFGDQRQQYFADKLASFPPNNMRDPDQDYSFKV